MAMRVKAPDIVEELRNGGRLHVSVTELKRNMDRIIDFINTDDREVYITRYGVVFAKIIPFKEDGS